MTRRMVYVALAVVCLAILIDATKNKKSGKWKLKAKGNGRPPTQLTYSGDFRDEYSGGGGGYGRYGYPIYIPFPIHIPSPMMGYGGFGGFGGFRGFGGPGGPGYGGFDGNYGGFGDPRFGHGYGDYGAGPAQQKKSSMQLMAARPVTA